MHLDTLNQLGILHFYKFFDNGEISNILRKRLDDKLRIDKRFGNFHLSEIKEIIDVIKNLNSKKTCSFNNIVFQDYDKKIKFSNGNFKI